MHKASGPDDFPPLSTPPAKGQQEMTMQIEAAERFLKNHFQDDTLDGDEVRRTAERFERIMGDAARFPNANLETIDAYLDAAYSWLGGLSHRLAASA